MGYCHLDLTLCLGRAAADQFVRAYDAASGGPVRELAFWDLLAAWRALPDASVWLPGWQAFGLRDLTAETVRSRLATFIQDVLLLTVPTSPQGPA